MPPYLLNTYNVLAYINLFTFFFLQIFSKLLLAWTFNSITNFSFLDAVSRSAHPAKLNTIDPFFIILEISFSFRISP